MPDSDDGTLYVNGKVIGKVTGLKIIPAVAAMRTRFELPAQLDATFGPTDPTLESLLPPEGA